MRGTLAASSTGRFLETAANGSDEKGGSNDRLFRVWCSGSFDFAGCAPIGGGFVGDQDFVERPAFARA